MTIPKVGKPTAVVYDYTQIGISWTGLAENLGIIKYKVLCVKTPGVPVPDGITDIIDNVTKETYDGTQNLVVIEPLTPGVSYTITVTAWDAQNNSSEPSDPSDPIIVVGLTGAPRGVTLSRSGTDVIVTWTPPVNNGYSEITEYYVVETEIDNSVWDPNSQMSIPIPTPTGQYSAVLPSQFKRVIMRAANMVGTGAQSALSNALGRGGGPLKVATPTIEYNESITGLNVDWVANNQETLTITKYVVDLWIFEGNFVQGFDLVVSNSGPFHLEIPNLVPGTSYACFVTPFAQYIIGETSNPSNVVMIPGGNLLQTVPDFPINVVAVAGGASATITWEAPVSDGGSAITEYIVVSTPDNKSQPIPADTYTCTMTGVKAGTSYTFQVFAKNAIGISGTSAAIVAL